MNQQGIQTAYQWLSQLSEEQVSRKPAPDVWSAKQILGHLVDSAGNHRARWVQMAAQPQQPLALPTWEQEFWQAVQRWQMRPWADILAFWYAYNLHLIHFAAQLTPEQLAHSARVGTLNDGQPMTLQQLLERYDTHLHHHLAQIRERAGA